MGMDARFTIWAGIKLDDDDGNGDKLREIAAKAPPDIFEPPEGPEDEYEFPELTWDAYTGKAPGLDGLKLEVITIGDERVGFGTCAFHAHWDDGATPLDPAELLVRARGARLRMQSLFAEWGVDIEVGVYCACDYS